MKVGIILFLFITLTASLFSHAANTEANNRTLFSVKYLNEIKNTKNDILNSLTLLRIELEKKKYPQAYFIRSIQEQVRTKNFLKKEHFSQTVELLTALSSSVQSQYSANRNLLEIKLPDGKNYILKLDNLKKMFDKENAIIPVSILDTEESSFLNWMSLRTYYNAMSLTDKRFILILVSLSLYLIFSAYVRTKNKYKSKFNQANKASKSGYGFSLNHFSEMPGVAFCVVNNKNQILKQNVCFAGLLMKKKGENFLFDNEFESDFSITSDKVFKLRRGDSETRFIVNTTSKNKNGEILFLINKIPNARTNQVDINSEKNFLDLIDSALVKYQSHNRKYKIDYSDVGNWNIDLHNLESLEKTLNNFFKMIYAVTLKDDRIYPIEFKILENRKVFQIRCVISGLSLSEEELSAPITIGKKVFSLKSMLTKIKNIEPNLAIKIKTKNLHNQDMLAFYLEIQLNREILTHINIEKSRITHPSL
ncbi:MAG: hypothetical protein L6Q33_00005 [Bacteriovoracaceae bacterium]|nr:hypothetical protein [Bacteriovoracaceae bacterium]